MYGGVPNFGEMLLLPLIFVSLVALVFKVSAKVVSASGLAGVQARSYASLCGYAFAISALTLLFPWRAAGGVAGLLICALSYYVMVSAEYRAMHWRGAFATASAIALWSLSGCGLVVYKFYRLLHAG